MSWWGYMKNEQGFIEHLYIYTFIKSILTKLTFRFFIHVADTFIQIKYTFGEVHLQMGYECA